MGKSVLVFMLSVLITGTLSAQKLPVIKATSLKVDIKEDGNLRKNVWQISPEVNPDVYKTSARQVTFYTNVDSIVLTLTPDKKYDFIILLNGKDTARTRVEWVPSKLDMLKKAEAYNYNDNRYIPKFTYQSQNDSGLIRVRKELKLDSIAGNGTELSQIFNLLHWVHNQVKHDGGSKNPVLKNAVDLVKICKAENRGINCRMMATVLNECYLSMGIKSRFITCMPKETEFDDCHVINMVYSTDLNKWIWIDPTFDAYVMDDKGNLLGIQEVRERLIKGLPMVINADANWNRTSLQQKSYYLDYYMAKNLYRLETPALSEYNTESRRKGKDVMYVELLPLDGIEQAPQKKEETVGSTGSKIINYKTNNPNLFWAKPE